MWHNSLWLWRWLPHRLKRQSKHQSLSTTTALLRTTFTWTIKLNLLLIYIHSSNNWMKASIHVLNLTQTNNSFSNCRSECIHGIPWKLRPLALHKLSPFQITLNNAFNENSFFHGNISKKKKKTWWQYFSWNRLIKLICIIDSGHDFKNTKRLKCLRSIKSN